MLSIQSARMVNTKKNDMDCAKWAYLFCSSSSLESRYGCESTSTFGDEAIRKKKYGRKLPSKSDVYRSNIKAMRGFAKVPRACI